MSDLKNTGISTGWLIFIHGGSPGRLPGPSWPAMRSCLYQCSYTPRCLLRQSRRLWGDSGTFRTLSPPLGQALFSKDIAVHSAVLPHYPAKVLTRLFWRAQDGMTLPVLVRSLLRGRA